VTIAIHLFAGDFSLLTATDTQETYSSGEKVDSGKIISFWRADPPGTINITGTGDSSYITALSQDIVRKFKGFSGTPEELEEQFRYIVREFHMVHVLPFVGKIEDVPYVSLLIAARHKGVGKLWTTEKTLVTECTPFECVGIGKPTADTLLSRLYPQYPTLDSVAVLAAYAIYRVKSSVDGCGLKTEIRFIHRDRLGIVSSDLIEKWESLFRKYERLEREVFFNAMNFVIRPPIPVSMESAFPSQIKSLPEIVKEIEEMRADFAKLTIFRP
jgi:hypothetical protein